MTKWLQKKRHDNDKKPPEGGFNLTVILPFFAQA